MNAEDLEIFLKDEQYVESWQKSLNWGNTYYSIVSTDSGVLQYLNNNSFPVVYADMQGFILVKFG